MKHVVTSTLLMALMVMASIAATTLPASAADYYYNRDGVLVQRTSVLSDILNSPVVSGNNTNWQYNPYSSGYRDGYRDGARYIRYDRDRDGDWDRNWNANYPPGHYHGKGKKLGHYKHR